MRKFFLGLLLAAFLPFIVGFGEVPPDKNIEQATVKKTILFPQDQLFYPPMASLKSPVPMSPTYGSTSPVTVSTSARSGSARASAWYAGPAGARRTPGSSASAGRFSPSSIWTPLPWT